MTYESAQPPAEPPRQPPSGEPPGPPPEPLQGGRPPEPVTAPPGYQPVPPPPPKKSNQTLRIVLIVLGVLAVLCCLGVILTGVFGYKAFRDATGPAKDALTGYFDDLKAENYGSAYDRLCSETQAAVTREDFIDFQRVLPAITDYKIDGVNIHDVSGKPRATVDVRVTRERGGEITQTVELIKEGGKWKVCEPGP
jgi:hypothetical protein